MYIYRKDWESNEHIKELFSFLFKSESDCNKKLGFCIGRTIEDGGFIKDDVLEYIANYDFGDKYFELIIRFFEKPEDVSVGWLEILKDIIDNKDEQDHECFISEVYGAFISGISFDKIKLCYENSENPHDFAVAIENNSSDGTYSKMLESLSAITNVIEKIEFDRNSQSQEFSTMRDSITNLKEQIKEKDDTVKAKDIEINRLNELLNCKSDITDEELSKLKKYREFYERKYNNAINELEKEKNENCKNKLRILELEKKIKEISQNTDSRLDNAEEDENLVEKIDTIIDKISGLDNVFSNILSIKNVTDGIQGMFASVHEELKALDDSNSSVINNEVAKLSNNINDYVDDKLNNINSNIASSFSEISKLIREKAYQNTEDNTKHIDNINEKNELVDIDLPFNENEDESEISEDDDINKEEANCSSTSSSIEVEEPNIFDIYNDEDMKSEREILDSSSDLKTGLVEDKLVEFSDEKKNFFSKFIKERQLRKSEQSFTKLQNNEMKKQKIIEYSMDNHIDRQIIKVIKEIFNNNDRGTTAISLNFIYRMLLHNASLEQMEDLRDFGAGSNKAG